MTDREMLIELLMQKGFGVEGASIASDHLLANGVTVGDKTEAVENPQWIPVKERLPKEAAFLAATRDGAVGEAFLEKEDIYWQEVAYYWEVGEPITDAVTHWMPLPEPPKKGYKNETT